MLEKLLDAMQEAVEAGKTIFTPHSRKAMHDDDLHVVDLEQCVLSGAIVEEQWDSTYDEFKYVIEGESTDGIEMGVVVRLDQKGQLVFITTYIYRYEKEKECHLRVVQSL
ncbi:MAG TPA: DUF4258 domain-containing protein [Blastocatellia bacterium]|nr:DUF4258 domain-containing protein [Blastocatellia bacterium]